MSKQLKIKQEFLDYIKNGIKDFEIRKEGYYDGEIDLVVFEKSKYCLEMESHMFAMTVENDSEINNYKTWLKF
ncbi:DUF3850 domain-containing protein [Spiroplasma endosymbiont of Labia minor]|uniref:DUF3850 domain-containing protein n=1 Tax=Spiroplasma endosymbiont of Labia minor TaxID=3066305 RepID=UPI0030D1ADE8